MKKNEHGFGNKDASFQAAGSVAGLERLVDSFYDRMENDERFAPIFAMHPDNNAMTRDKLARFLSGWLGGPKRFQEKYGAIGIPRVHGHLPISETERDQWLTCMTEAVAEQPYTPEFKRYLMEQLAVPAEAVRRRCEAATPKPAVQLWVDADACPVVIKEILFRAATRTGIALTLVANQPLATPPARNITSVQVPSGFDIADDEIVKRCNPGDLVITSDIPLAAEVIEKDGHALSPRGELFTKENIRGRLNMRDFLDTMRASGVDASGGPAPFSQRDKQLFANQLDQFLTRHYKKEG